MFALPMATIRTLMAVSLLVCDLACRHFGSPIVSMAGTKPMYSSGLRLARVRVQHAMPYST
jgi:hypothetical protein